MHVNQLLILTHNSPLPITLNVDEKGEVVSPNI